MHTYLTLRMASVCCGVGVLAALKVRSCSGGPGSGNLVLSPTAASVFKHTAIRAARHGHDAMA